MVQNVTIAGKEEKTSSTQSLGLITRLNDDLTKGEFVNASKDMGVLEAQQMGLRNEGLQRQFLQMDVCEIQTSINLELNHHSDWETSMAN